MKYLSFTHLIIVLALLFSVSCRKDNADRSEKPTKPHSKKEQFLDTVGDAETSNNPSINQSEKTDSLATDNVGNDPTESTTAEQTTEQTEEQTTEQTAEQAVADTQVAEIEPVVTEQAPDTEPAIADLATETETATATAVTKQAIATKPAVTAEQATESATTIETPTVQAVPVQATAEQAPKTTETRYPFKKPLDENCESNWWRNFKAVFINNYGAKHDAKCKPPKEEIKFEDTPLNMPLKNTDNNICFLPSVLRSQVASTFGVGCSNVSISQMKEMKSLKIEELSFREALELKDLDRDFAEYFKSLENLDLSDNHPLLELPNFVYYISSLKKLDISRTSINGFKKDICRLKDLNTLIASHNSYKDQEVPKEIFCLKNLKILDMSDSSIRYIDEYIGKLEKLEELYMANNQLVLIPHMLTELLNVTVVDFTNNQIVNEDMNMLHNCNNSKFDEDDKEDCKEDMREDMTCEGVYEYPYARGEPLREMYIKLAIQSPELMSQCEDDDPTNYCPNFIKECLDVKTDQLKCMLDNFESTWAEFNHRPHRDRCYLNWVGFLVDYEKYPHLLEKTIRGKTIREMHYVEKYTNHFTCWPWPWEGVRLRFMWITWFDDAPDKYPVNTTEIFPLDHRNPGIATHILARSFFKEPDYLFFVPEHCPHLPNLKETIDKIFIQGLSPDLSMYYVE